MPRTVGLRRILVVLPPDDNLHKSRPAQWYERWELLRTRFEFLPAVTRNNAAVMFTGDDRPILVPAGASAIPKRLAAIKKAWLEQTAGNS